MAKQAKYLEERLKLQQGEDEDEKPSDDEEGRDELRERLWGASKRAYYGGDDAEVRVRAGVSCLCVCLVGLGMDQAAAGGVEGRVFSARRRTRKSASAAQCSGRPVPAAH